jgi:polyferredoxin/Tfp pilus assembly protein PilF
MRASRTSRRRAAVLIAVNLLMIAHFIQWRLMGTTLSPIEPSEAMHTLQRGAVNAGFIFFTLALAATLVFGRFVCGWGCHMLALQDLCAWLLAKLGLRPQPFRSRLLVFVPLIGALYMFVWSTGYRFFTGPPDQPLIPPLTNHLVTTNFWETFPTVWVAMPFLFICGFVTVYFLGSKGFCTYACPYGGFFGLADKVAPGKIRVTDACNQCGHCTATCTSNVLVHAEVKRFGMVVDPGCMKCMDCVSVCPNDALYFGFGKPTVAVPGRAALAKGYSLTWPEEFVAAGVFLASFLAVRGVYALVPFLMALGCASVTTFLVMKTGRLLRASHATFYRVELKTAGRIRGAGWAFLSFALPWIAVTAHSGWVRYHEAVGARGFEVIAIPDELALADANPLARLSSPERANIVAGREHLRRALDFGLFTNVEALPKLAWLEFLSGNAERSVQLLATAATRQTGQARALSLYYRGAILNRLGQHAQAQASLDQALTERPDLILAREELGESLWRAGRHEDAVAVWSDAVQRNPQLVVANNQLAGAAMLEGNPEAARAHRQRADQATPPEPLFHWVLGMRLQNIGMHTLAAEHFERALRLDPALAGNRNRGGAASPGR